MFINLFGSNERVQGLTYRTPLHNDIVLCVQSNLVYLQISHFPDRPFTVECITYVEY